MALTITRDADNKWYVYIDWNPWIDAQAESSPSGPNLTVSITSVSWAIPAALVEEAETTSDDVGGITYFVGSSGTNGVNYDLVCTITYSATELSATDLTQDRTITVRLQNQ